MVKMDGKYVVWAIWDTEKVLTSSSAVVVEVVKEISPEVATGLDGEDKMLREFMSW